MMILYSVALMLEARPLVTALGLKAMPEQPFPVFGDGRRLLVVSGTGSHRAAAALGWALGRWPAIGAAANLGFGGAAEGVAGLREWYLVHAVRDKASGRLYIPDILFRHPFEERGLLSVPRVSTGEPGWNGLVDMEGSGFIEAARRFLAVDRILLLKWVSDPLSGEIEVEATRAAFTEAVQGLLPFLENWEAIHSGETEDRSTELASRISERLNLTRTQTAFLRKWADGYLRRGGPPEAILTLLPDETPTTRRANTACFNRLRDAFEDETVLPHLR